MPIIDRLLAALNAHDLEAFVACYDQNATIEDGNDQVIALGREGIRLRFEAMFETFPNLQVEPLGRWEAGPFIVQDERVTGRSVEPERHIAIYQVVDDLVVRERLLR